MADNLPPKFNTSSDEPDTEVVKLDDDSSLKEARQQFQAQSAPAPESTGLALDDQNELQTIKRLKLISFAALGLALVALLAALFLGSSGGFSVADIPNGSLGSNKLAPGAISAAALSPEAQKALQGPRGPAGPAGKNIVGGLQLEIIESESASNNKVTKRAEAECPAGTKLLGGGATVTGGDDVFISNSGPVVDLNDRATTWRASAESLSVSNKEWLLTVSAICSKRANSGAGANSDTAPSGGANNGNSSSGSTRGSGNSGSGNEPNSVIIPGGTSG